MSGNRPFETVLHMLVDAVERSPDHEAFVCENERLSYREFMNCTLGFADELSKLGMQNERVALVMGNSIDICIAMYAVHMNHAQVAPLNPTYTEHELRPMLEDAAVKMVIYDAVNKEAVENLIAELDIPSFCARPSAPTNLTRHQAVDLNVPIGCGGVAVFPGDIAVGDGDGVIIIPAELADEIAAEAKGMEKYEAWVVEQVKAGASIIGLYPMNDETRARYEAWLAEQDES